MLNRLLLICLLSGTYAYAQIQVSGYLTEGRSGEPLVGARLVDTLSRRGTETNGFGYFQLSLPQDSVVLRLSHVGYATAWQSLVLTRDTTLNLTLAPRSLDEVVIEARQAPWEQTRMSTLNLSVETLQALPRLGGEADPLRALQLLPGVQVGNEGVTGLYVRGGGPDQNLILLDDIPLYNVSHLFGLFSVFNADALKHIELIKGGMPPQYGGRMASVLDIRMREGNLKRWEGSASVGLVSAHGTIEGPIVKDRASILFSARRTYLDAFLRPLSALANDPDESGSQGYFFHDFNLKANYILNDRHRLFLSGYWGQDRFSNRLGTTEVDANGQPAVELQQQSLAWGNKLLGLRWNWLINSAWFANTTVSVTDYQLSNDLGFELESTVGGDLQRESYRSEYLSRILDYRLKQSHQWSLAPWWTLRAGTEATWHRFVPGVQAFEQEANGNTRGDTLGTLTPTDAWELRAYVSNELQLGPRLGLTLGLHSSWFGVGDSLYSALEPRVIANYRVGPRTSLKASYTRQAQYLHLLFNTGSGAPVELWVPPTERVPPQYGWQAAAGVSTGLWEGYSLSVEGYYRYMQGLIELKEGSSFLIQGDDWEDQVATRGEGWAYGAEFLLRKEVGDLTGWLGYTLSWSDRRFDQLNGGRKFPYRFDRRHDISVVGVYQPNDRWQASISWVFGTGQSLTLVDGVHPNPNYPPIPNSFLILDRPGVDPPLPGTQFPAPVEVLVYSDRNANRLPPYHRLDLGVSFFRERKRFKRTWDLSLYNAYSRRNPYYVYFSNNNNSPSAPNAFRGEYRLVSLFPIIPSFSYKLEF